MTIKTAADSLFPHVVWDLYGRNVGGLTRRMRRAGRSSPKQFRNLAGRRRGIREGLALKHENMI